MAEFVKRAIPDQWMHDHRIPGKFIDLLWDPPPGKRGRKGNPLRKYGKCLFIVDDTISYEGLKGTAPQICIVDIITQENGAVVRKPNWRSSRAGAKAGRFTYSYHQVFLPLDRIGEITDALRKLAGCEASVELKKAEAEESVRVKIDEVDREVEEFFKSKLGGGT